MSEAPEHHIRSYEQELKHLRELITRMGGIVESQVALARNAVLGLDSLAATQAIELDPSVDSLEQEIEQFVIRLIALRQPVADDLRHLVARYTGCTPTQLRGRGGLTVALAMLRS